MGICYSQGMGVEQDYAEAVKWFQSAADADHPAGKMNLAISYFEGEGVEQDKEKAVQLLLEAAEYMPDAQFLWRSVMLTVKELPKMLKKPENGIKKQQMQEL